MRKGEQEANTATRRKKTKRDREKYKKKGEWEGNGAGIRERAINGGKWKGKKMQGVRQVWWAKRTD